LPVITGLPLSSGWIASLREAERIGIEMEDGLRGGGDED
jgi:hypothetical protein